MTPHPILMHVMHDDRSRAMDAEVTWRQRLEQEIDVVEARSTPRRSTFHRVLALLAPEFRRQQVNVSNTRA
jgi:hypothetical protein